MRVVLVHRYFWPDTPPYAHILRVIAGTLAADGHEVTVLTAQPSYNREQVAEAPAAEVLPDGVRVLRTPVFDDRRSTVLKALNLARFALAVTRRARRIGPADVYMAATTPPIVVAGVVARIARRNGAAFVYHKQDIYPEVVTAPGILRDGRWARLLRRIDARTERRSAAVVVLGEDMAATVRARGTEPASVHVINNFDPWEVDEPAASSTVDPATDPEPPARADGPLRLVFAGNLGRFQNLETVLAALIALGPDGGVELDFYGHGALAGSLQARAEAHRLPVRFHGHRPPAEVAAAVRDQADLGIVSLEPGVVRAAYPSKTMTYLRQGCPVLALVEADSALAADLVASGAGIQADPTDAGAVAEVLRGLATDPAALAGRREAALALYRREFTAERQLGRWRELFATLPAGSPSGAGVGADR